MKIYGKLLEAKKQIGKVSKNAKNPHFKNTYADINALIEAVEPILLECGLVLLQPIVNGKVITQIIDVESGEKIESIIELSSNLTSQALGSQITYYRRYSLQSLMSLQADDDDGQRASAPQPKVKPTLSTQQFEKAIERIINGEFELYGKLKESFVFTPAQELEFKEVLDVKN
jgi:hypothetical protein